MYSEEIQTNIHKIFEINIKNIEELYKLRLNKSRTDFMVQVVLSLVSCRNVQFGEIADKMSGSSEVESKHRQIQRFISEYELDYYWIAHFILLLLPKQGKLKMCLDRTEWEFGDQNHNILVVTAYTHGIGIPIWFEVLDNQGGNSCTEDRMYIMLELLSVLGKERIACMIADCEFIGQEWVKWLISEGFTFFIDVRSNQYIEYKGKRHQISTILGNQKTKSLRDVKIFGETLNLSLRKSPKRDKKILAIVSNASVSEALNIYKLRWSIETLFANLKTRGFNLEKTHLKDPQRIRKLFALVAIAFTICFIVGLMGHKIKPLKVKKHGYKQNSFFRNGLNIIRKIMKKNNKLDFNPILQHICQLIQENISASKKIVM